MCDKVIYEIKKREKEEREMVVKNYSFSQK